MDGFRHSFDLGYRGPLLRRDTSQNIPISVGFEEEIWNKLLNEVEWGRHAGPFTDIPFEYYVQSPVGLVPKAGNKTRLIFHLSYDFGKEQDENWESKRSVNYFIPEEHCSVKYNDLDYAVWSILHMLSDGDPSIVNGEETVGNGQDKVAYMAKSNLMRAFKILPILPTQRFLLVMTVKNPLSNTYMYFVEKNLPFGASCSCNHFQLFSDSLKHLIEHVLDREFCVTNYLDDYMFIHVEQELCNNMVRRFLELCQDIGCPVSLEKTVWASTRMIFLGIMLDGCAETLCVPEDKRLKALNLIRYAVDRKKVTV